jgi:hypothetical protein
VPDSIQRSHLKAVASIYDLKQNDLSLRIEEKSKSGHTDITLINTNANSGQLLSQVCDISEEMFLLFCFFCFSFCLSPQLNTIAPPKDSNLSRVRVFSSADGELALNMFSFEREFSPK